MTNPSPRYELVNLDHVPDDVREMILEVGDKSGFIPNVFLLLARRPAEFRAFFAYHDAVMNREESSLSNADREMIITAVSGANNCLYCVVAHGALLRIYSKNPRLADQVSTNPNLAEISDRQRAMLDFALTVNAHPDDIGDADFQALRDHGVDDEDIWDITAIASFYGMSNRLATVTGLMPNEEFYLMGRVPRAKN